MQLIDKLGKRPTFLMVGTIEPRKSHAQALAAFEVLWKRGIDANLVIVGKQGWMVEALIDRLRDHPERDRRLFWLQQIDDAFLTSVYDASSCLILASRGEGFGLPIIEAAHRKLPLVLRDIPVFREVAGEHAMYFEGLEASDLAHALEDWLHLHAAGDHPRSENIRFLSWKESTRQLIDVLLDEHGGAAGAQAGAAMPPAGDVTAPAVSDGSGHRRSA
jgi:glycosyltransferase involved in cell wall biosynthesis